MSSTPHIHTRQFTQDYNFWFVSVNYSKLVVYVFYGNFAGGSVFADQHDFASIFAADLYYNNQIDNWMGMSKNLVELNEIDFHAIMPDLSKSFVFNEYENCDISHD